jgi:hypothetical protein
MLTVILKIILKNKNGFKVSPYQCCEYGSGIRGLFDPWIRDPGWVKDQDPDPGKTTRLIFPRA